MRCALTTFAVGLMLVVGDAPTFAVEGDPLASSEVTAALQSYLDHYKLAGYIGIIADRSGKVRFKNMHGYANVEVKQPIREDNVFWIVATRA